MNGQNIPAHSPTAADGSAPEHKHVESPAYVRHIVIVLFATIVAGLLLVWCGQAPRSLFKKETADSHAATEAISVYFIGCALPVLLIILPYFGVKLWKEKRGEKVFLWHARFSAVIVWIWVISSSLGLVWAVFFLDYPPKTVEQPPAKPAKTARPLIVGQDPREEGKKDEKPSKTESGWVLSLADGVGYVALGTGWILTLALSLEILNARREDG